MLNFKFLFKVFQGLHNKNLLIGHQGRFSDGGLSQAHSDNFHVNKIQFPLIRTCGNMMTNIATYVALSKNFEGIEVNGDDTTVIISSDNSLIRLIKGPSLTYWIGLCIPPIIHLCTFTPYETTAPTNPWHLKLLFPAKYMLTKTIYTLLLQTETTFFFIILKSSQ